MADQLDRRLTLGGATAVNVLAMIGVGPFVTIPLLLRTMGGPQAMVGWFIGAVVALADGLVWAELGAAMPRSGGGYQYLLEAYGPQGIRPLAQFSVSLANGRGHAARDGIRRDRVRALRRFFLSRQ